MASAARTITSPILFTSDADWQPVLDDDVGLLVDQRLSRISPKATDEALTSLGSMLSYAGSVEALPAALAGLPAELADDVRALAGRFAALMNVSAIRLRLERIETDACRKWHLDYTDLRLVVTYSGPGTQFRQSEGAAIEQIGEQEVALFKGRDTGPAHAMVFHRSPPIAGTGVQRLVLAIDTLSKHGKRRSSFKLRCNDHCARPLGLRRRPQPRSLRRAGADGRGRAGQTPEPALRGRGSPTVILESGLGWSSLSWRKVQPRLAKLTRTCSYDRAGLGFSDPGPMPRRAAIITDDVERLVDKGRLEPPYLLVGNSMGGQALRRPHQVSGIVLADPYVEGQYPELGRSSPRSPMN